MATNNQDLQDYQDYLDYQKYQSNPSYSTSAQTQTAIEGAGNAYSLGQLPKLQALVQSYIPDPTSGIDRSLKDEGVEIQQPNYNDYGTALQQWNQHQKDISSQMPNAYYGSEGAAMLSQAAPAGLMGGRGLIQVGKKAYEFANSPPGKMIERLALPVAAYLGLKKKSGDE